MSGGDFENYKFIMIPEEGGAHRSRERHGDRRGGRQEHHTMKYSSHSKNRSGSPMYGGNPHVYRGGVRQYPKPSSNTYLSSSSSALHSSHRGVYNGGRCPTRYPTRLRSFAPRGVFRGGPPYRGRGNYHGRSYRSDGTPPPPLAMGRKPRVHPLPYAVSPVRIDDSSASGAAETLNKGELLARMRDAKESDNFDELYRLREYYRELKSRGLPTIRVPSKPSSSKSRHGDGSPTETADWELEEIECIEETFDDDDELEEAEQEVDEDERKERGKEASVSKSSERTAERSGGSSSRSSPRKRSPSDRHKEPRRSERPSNGERNGSAHKEATKRSATTEADVIDKAESRSGRDKSGEEADGQQSAVTMLVSASSKRRRRCDDSSYGEDEDDEVEDLQFAEDSIDVEAMVKASEAGSRPDESAEDETADFMAALINDEDGDNGADIELDYEVASGTGVSEATPSLSMLLTAEANRQLAMVSAEKRGRLYRQLLARHRERPARFREDVEAADFRRFVPALVRALATELPTFLADAKPIAANPDIESRVTVVLNALDARPADDNEELEERSEWALDDDQPVGRVRPITVERRVGTAVALILRHLRSTTTTPENVETTSSSRVNVY